jgi:hypothetical protein
MASTIGSRRFEKGTAVSYKSSKWIVCDGGEADPHKHLCYKVRRGSKTELVRGDKLARW